MKTWLTRTILAGMILTMMTPILAQDETGLTVTESGVDAQVYWPQGVNCVLPMASLEGQAYRLSGVSEGMKDLGEVGGIALKPEELAQVLGLNDTWGPEPVAIIVIDFFEPPVPDGTAPGVAHGEMVFRHIEGMIAGSFTGTGSIVVHRLQVPPGLDTNALAAALEERMRLIHNTYPGALVGDDPVPHQISHFVVNMSFAIVPCDANIDHATYDVVVNDLITDLQGDLLPHEDALELQSRNCDAMPFAVQYVAAAGNSGGPFTLYPAAWDFVTGVGATEIDDWTPNDPFVSGITTHRAPYSNLGDIDAVGNEILAIGGWINGLTDFPDVVVRGTSFASPTYSVMRAIEMSNEPPAFNSCAIEQPQE